MSSFRRDLDLDVEVALLRQRRDSKNHVAAVLCAPCTACDIPSASARIGIDSHAIGDISLTTFVQNESNPISTIRFFKI